MSEVEGRAVPLHCPFCADEDLRPAPERGWVCAACRRVFTVSMIGLALGELT